MQNLQWIQFFLKPYYSVETQTMWAFLAKSLDWDYQNTSLWLTASVESGKLKQLERCDASQRMQTRNVNSSDQSLALISNSPHHNFVIFTSSKWVTCSQAGFTQFHQN